MSNNKSLYLPNLNAVRAIAAFVVIISHIERKMSFFNLETFQPLTKIGPIGVTLFFALSGFLITYLLLIEKERFVKINIKDFYVRRFLRIWPIYYIVLLFVYLIIPYILPEYYLQEKDRFSFQSALLNVFFLTNITMILKYTPLIINVIWSIGIEEQFYLFWPWIIKSKKHLNRIIVIIFLLPVLKVIMLLFSLQYSEIKIVYDILNITRFDTMAVGGLFGLLAYKKSISFKYFTINITDFTNKKLQFFLYVFTFGMIIYLLQYDFLLNIYNFQVLPFLFSIMLLNLINYENSILKLENKILNYLGKISYSLYLLHLIFFYLFFPYLKNILNDFKWNVNVQVLIIYIISILGSILIASFSFEFIEKKFLYYKRFFTHVKTGK